MSAGRRIGLFDGAVGIAALTLIGFSLFRRARIWGAGDIVFRIVAGSLFFGACGALLYVVVRIVGQNAGRRGGG